MPRYYYKAMDAGGRDATGAVEAETQDEAIGSLRERGLYVIRIGESEEPLKQNYQSGEIDRALHDNVRAISRAIGHLVFNHIIVPAVALLAVAAFFEIDRVVLTYIGLVALSIMVARTASAACRWWAAR